MDTSGYVMGTILSQLCDDEKWHPVSFTSKSLNSAEHNYAIYDKEMLLVRHGLEEWRHILEGTTHTIEILNDNKNLRYFRMAKTLNCRQACWSLYLSQFNYSLAHRAGRHLAKPDALSRRVDYQVDGEDNEDQVILLMENFEAGHPDRSDELSDQKIGETVTDPAYVHIDSEGSHFLDHIHGCANRDEL